MTAKEFMSQAWEANHQITEKQYRFEELRSKAESMITAMNGFPRSASPNLQQMESDILEIIDLEQEIEVSKAEFNSIRQRIVDVIMKVEDQKLSVLLELRYLWFLPWKNIAERMCLSKRQVLRIHSSALCNITRILSHETS